MTELDSDFWSAIAVTWTLACAVALFFWWRRRK